MTAHPTPADSAAHATTASAPAGSAVARPTLHPESLLVSLGRPAAAAGAPINQPIELTSTFHAGGPVGYARDGTATTAAFEAAVGQLDGGLAVAFASGIAAISALIDTLPVGSVVVLPATFYNFARTLLQSQEALGKVVLRTVDTTDSDAVIAELDGAAVLWLEIPSNPTLTVADLPRLARAARAAGALTVVDSTLATPLGLRPLAHGADVVMHSVTKWIGGHGDLIGGVLTTADPELAKRLHDRRTLTGAIPGALECYLALRGLRTLSVRMQRSCETAAVLADRLLDHPAVTGVHYLGLPEHPQAELVAALLGNHGGLLSFTTDSVERADQLCARVRLITHATSLGGVESLIERRGTYPGELAQATPPELLRLSVGIEHVEDLWDDLAAGLA